MIDNNTIISELRSKYPKVSFKIENNRLYANGIKICVLRDSIPEVTDISKNTIKFIELQLKELIGDNPETDIHQLVNVPTVGDMKKALAPMPDNYMLVGNCVDMFDRWYNYPVYVVKADGNNTMVAIQSKPIDENQITKNIEEFRTKAKDLAYKIYKKTGQDHRGFIEEEIMKLIGQ